MPYEFHESIGTLLLYVGTLQVPTVQLAKYYIEDISSSMVSTESSGQNRYQLSVSSIGNLSVEGSKFIKRVNWQLSIQMPHKPIHTRIPANNQYYE